MPASRPFRKGFIRKTGFPGLLGLLGLLELAALVQGCTEQGTEQQISSNLTAMQSALEDKDSEAALAHVAAEFLGNRALDRKALQGFLELQFLRHKKVEIVLTDLEIHPNPVDPLRATMSGTALLLGLENLLPESGKLYRFNGEWLLVRDDWQLTRLQWQ